MLVPWAALAVESGSGNGWPVCSSCGAPRVARCPWCGTWGRWFPKGDPAPDGTGLVRQICPTCDEPFVAQFGRQCEWCGRTFDEGFAPPSLAAPRIDVPRAVVWLALAGAFVGVLVILAGWR